MLSEDIKAAQAEYAARPWVARVRTRWFSGSFRFDTENEAVGYIAYQSSFPDAATYDWQAEVEGPRGKRSFDKQDVR
jgi:hypothetical protein